MSKLYPFGEVTRESERIFKVKSFVKKDVEYTVRVNTAGRWFCSCPYSVFGNKEVICKHLLAVKDYLKNEKEEKSESGNIDRGHSRFETKHKSFRGNVGSDKGDAKKS